jgi:signal transduction histidine kinase
MLSLHTNLLANRVDAALPGGEVGVRVGAGPDGMLMAEVTHTGPGIDPVIGDRLFIAFAAPKPTGTGLGLTIAWRVARVNRGTLTAVNRAGAGARFTFTLPAPEAPDAEAPAR